jgi:hypothetical protein
MLQYLCFSLPSLVVVSDFIWVFYFTYFFAFQYLDHIAVHRIAFLGTSCQLCQIIYLFLFLYSLYFCQNYFIGLLQCMLHSSKCKQNFCNLYLFVQIHRDNVETKLSSKTDCTKLFTISIYLFCGGWVLSDIPGLGICHHLLFILPLSSSYY